MKYQNILMVLTAVLLLSTGTPMYASTEDESAGKSEEAELQLRLEAEYEKAMAEAERQRLSAETRWKKHVSNCSGFPGKRSNREPGS